jgi:catalase
VAGIRASDGTSLAVREKVDGAPSVLYDAVAVLTTKEGAGQLARRPAARDFITDAYAHCKFVGYTDDASPLLAATGLASALDEGFIELNGNAADFVAQCRQLRHWPRAMATA